MVPELPNDVREWLLSVFRGCNAYVSGRLQALPTTHEPALDHAFIEHLSQYQSRFFFGSGWTITITAEYEGGRRHYRHWEIADIGLIFIFRHPSNPPIRKLALLQSKRLYPVETESVPAKEGGFYEIWDILHPGSKLEELAVPRTFRVSEHSRYSALKVADEQFRAIAAHEADTTVPVYYQFYNPSRLPAEIQIPRPPALVTPDVPLLDVGVRIVPYSTLAASLAGTADGYSPSYEDLLNRLPEPFQSAEMRAGWTLEHFVVDEALRCREGYRENGPEDYNMARVVSLRGAPISAAVAVTFDLPA